MKQNRDNGFVLACYVKSGFLVVAKQFIIETFVPQLLDTWQSRDQLNSSEWYKQGTIWGESLDLLNELFWTVYHQNQNGTDMEMKIYQASLLFVLYSGMRQLFAIWKSDLAAVFNDGKVSLLQSGKMEAKSFFNSQTDLYFIPQQQNPKKHLFVDPWSEASIKHFAWCFPCIWVRGGTLHLSSMLKKARNVVRMEASEQPAIEREKAEEGTAAVEKEQKAEKAEEEEGLENKVPITSQYLFPNQTLDMTALLSVLNIIMVWIEFSTLFRSRETIPKSFPYPWESIPGAPFHKMCQLKSLSHVFIQNRGHVVRSAMHRTVNCKNSQCWVCATEKRPQLKKLYNQLEEVVTELITCFVQKKSNHLFACPVPFNQIRMTKVYIPENLENLRICASLPWEPQSQASLTGQPLLLSDFIHAFLRLHINPEFKHYEHSFRAIFCRLADNDPETLHVQVESCFQMWSAVKAPSRSAVKATFRKTPSRSAVKAPSRKNSDQSALEPSSRSAMKATSRKNSDQSALKSPS